MDNNTQNNRVMELWRAVIERAIKDEAYDELSAMPDELFRILGMDADITQEELDGYVLSTGCSVSVPVFYPDECLSGSHGRLALMDSEDIY